MALRFKLYFWLYCFLLSICVNVAQQGINNYSEESLYVEATKEEIDVNSNVEINLISKSVTTNLENIWPSDEVSIEEPRDVSVNATDGVNITSIVQEVNETKKIIQCKLTMLNSTSEDRLLQAVEVVNNTRLADLLVPNIEITNKESEAQCIVVLFYSRLCPFSSMAGPHFNALARSFPDIKMVALDALKFHSVNTQYGIVGVPTMILFHNGRPIAKFNGTEYTIHSFVKFIQMYTGIKEDVTAVLSQDFQGPVPSVTDKEVDYFLVLSWIFIAICTIYFFSRSFLCKLIVEMVKNNWRESEAQHAHTD